MFRRARRQPGFPVSTWVFSRATCWPSTPSTGAAGHLNILLSEKDGRTTVTLTYDVGGYMNGGLDTLAAPVDGVLGQQVARLKTQVETGKPG